MLGWLSRAKQEAGWLAVGIETDAVRVAQVIPSASGKPRAGRWGVIAKVTDDRAVSLAKAAREHNLPRCQCTLLLLPGEYQIMAVDAPNVSRDELKAAIRWKIKDLLDYHVDDATVDVLEIPGELTPEGKARSMYAIAAPNEVIQKRTAAFDEPRLELKVIDIPEMAQRNIASRFEQAERSTAMVSFGQWGGLLTFTQKAELLLARRLEVTSEQLGLPEHRAHYFERVTTELRRSFENLERRFLGAPVGELLLAPLPGEIGLAEHLAANLYVPVRQINLGDVVEFAAGAEMDKSEQWRFFHLFGAALRQEAKAL